ncbi:MAG: lipid IV(A) 3-deoxy-D-manno-octulosonic acid transferase [Gammaproteobacteria bacterium]
MRYIYTFCYTIAIPFILLRLYWRGRKLPGYRKRVLERFSIISKPQQENSIWFHTVSLGEVIAAIPLIKTLQLRYPDTLISITTMTPSGSERVKAVFNDTVYHVYVPYDLPWLINKFLKIVKPKLLIILETELWPNLLACCHRAGLPVFLANARMSARSVERYAKIQPLTRQMLNQITQIAVQTEEEAKRYMRLGMPEKRISVTGSIKFDISVPDDHETKLAALRPLLGIKRPVFLCASTHQGEEELILQMFKIILEKVPNCLLLLVPRHPDRFDEVAELCTKHGFKIARRSKNQVCTEETTIFLGDSIGEMLLYYDLADLAFVGGSLIPVGGHNLLEPAVLGKLAITGPHMHNFVAITELLLKAEAIKQIQEPHELADVVIAFLQDETLCKKMGEQARNVVVKNRGALAKHVELIDAVL